MKNFLLLLLFTVIVACSEKTPETQSKAYIPELVITDSITIDRLTQPTFIDVKNDKSEFLFFDFKTSDFFRISKSGELLKTANLTGDGKNTIQSTYFVGAKYGEKNEIVIQTMTATFTYDLDFQLKNKVTSDFSLVLPRVGGSRGFETYGDYIYTFSIDEKDRSTELMQSKNFSNSYPFITLRDSETLNVVESDSVPATSYVAQYPGQYLDLDPIVKFAGNEMFVLFPNSPEMYVYNLPSLRLRDQWPLNPEKSYRQMEPSTSVGENDVNRSLSAGRYQNFVFSNGYLLTAYQGAVPQDEVDALASYERGGDEYKALVNKYRSMPYYQLFKGKSKLWEGQWNVKLSMLRDVIFAFSKPDEDPDAFEKDVQTIYFYELK
ncbi:hypothetical protein SAMN04489724_2501 [Algoriphagus locisalis]|uniref:DUF4221 domain-containing protein n=1 Tax=Algoriphagus locisalis TaxID=305507 RepID=A0A1I7BKQ3_9BACT|nr:hypothetical protein [Algoriphagus locisalis]SFT87746.1 hypothetical protein SAMN04489724_2501 [Algoriphagus locisalis]